MKRKKTDKITQNFVLPPLNTKPTVFHIKSSPKILISDTDITHEEMQKKLKYIHITFTTEYT